MSALGINRFTQAFAVAISDAGERIASRPVAAVDRLAWRLFEWAGSKDLDVTFRFLYPFVGGTAVSHSFNLADPNTGRIEWEGVVVHSNLGIVGDGASGAGITNVALAGPLASDSFVMCGVYSRTANIGAFAEIGNFGAGGGIIIYCRHSTSGTPAIFLNGNTQLNAPGLPNSQGLFHSTRYSAASFYCYRNGVSQTFNTVANPAVSPPAPFGILCNLGDGSRGLFSNRNLAFAFLTNAVGVAPIFQVSKQAELYTWIQGFQASMLRQV
jgi:hypothetical protein